MPSTFLRAPATWLFAAAWLLAAASLWLRGRLEDVAATALVAIIVLLGIGLTLAVTPRPPSTPRRSDTSTRIQAAFLVVLVAFSCVRFGPPWLAHATGWGSLPLITYPLLVFVIPVAIVVGLGARGPELGLHRGYRSLAAGAVWIALRALLLGPAILAGQGLRLAAMLVLHLVFVAFPEELLFRGLLQTRLSLLFGSAWAVVVTALLFGLWHLGINTGAAGGDLATGLARCVLVQGTLGLGYSLAFERTRSLVSSSLAHAAFNAI
ncbi:MAG TPA: CPBP family intramembrane glutamic endopeptidase [Candidatus Limnocylindria bacterium]|nr:CPBP family intramembrane glutamic endopeptidase [Candidatus Limnocylindria bacterium]